MRKISLLAPFSETDQAGEEKESLGELIFCNSRDYKEEYGGLEGCSETAKLFFPKSYKDFMTNLEQETKRRNSPPEPPGGSFGLNTRETPDWRAGGGKVKEYSLNDGTDGKKEIMVKGGKDYLNSPPSGASGSAYSAGGNTPEWRGYGPRTKEEGEIVCTKKGWFQVIKGEDTYLEESPAGKAFWVQDKKEGRYGWYGVRGEKDQGAYLSDAKVENPDSYPMQMAKKAVKAGIAAGIIPDPDKMGNDDYKFIEIGGGFGKFLSGAVGGMIDKKGNVYAIMSLSVGAGLGLPVSINAGWGYFGGVDKEDSKDYVKALQDWSLGTTKGGIVKGNVSGGLNESKESKGKKPVLSGEISFTTGVGATFGGRYTVFLFNIKINIYYWEGGADERGSNGRAEKKQ